MSRRERILAAAVELFQRYGFRKTTVGEIAQAAGIGKGSVYLEFSSKEDVFLALVEGHEHGILQEIRHVASRPLPVSERLTEVALVRPRRNIEEMEHLPEIFEILASLRGQVADRVKPYQNQCLDVVAALVQEGVHEGVFQVGDCTEAASLFYRAFDVSFVFAMNGMQPDEIEATLRRLAHLLIHGMAVEGEPVA